ncbi:hypothetical protein [Streptomyces sp. NPDC060322]
MQDTLEERPAHLSRTGDPGARVPRILLAGAEEDDDEPNIVRGID